MAVFVEFLLEDGTTTNINPEHIVAFYPDTDKDPDTTIIECVNHQSEMDYFFIGVSCKTVRAMLKAAGGCLCDNQRHTI